MTLVRGAITKKLPALKESKEWKKLVDGKAVKESLTTPKDAHHLVVPQFVTGIAKVLSYGAKKYAAHNWERGLSWEEVYGALQRHLHAWYAGQENDSETKLSHLLHAGCCLMFLFWYTINPKYKQFDDRAFKL